MTRLATARRFTRKRAILRWCVVAAGILGGQAAPLRAQAWAARFPPDPRCRSEIVSHRVAGEARAELTVLPLQWDAPKPIGAVRVTLRGLGEIRDSVVVRIGATPADSAREVHLRNLVPGSYVLTLVAFGYERRTDTLVLASGARDTVRARLLDVQDGYGNAFNCRPRGFRRPGESACVTDADEADVVLGQARRLDADTVRAARVRLVRDERICERAGRAYGGPDSPPRRVVVVETGRGWLVLDPFEPHMAGEWQVSYEFDRRWRRVGGLAG